MHVLSIEIALAQLGGLIQISVFFCLIYFPEQGNQETERRNLPGVQWLWGLEMGGSQNWPCSWISSHLSVKFIGHLLKIKEGLQVWEKVKCK